MTMILDYAITLLFVAYKYILVDTNHQFQILYYIVLLVIIFLCQAKIIFQMKHHHMPPLGNLSYKILILFCFVLFMTTLSRDANFILPFFIGAAFAYDDYRQFIKKFLVSSCICFALHFLFYSFGLLPQRPSMIRTLANGQIVQRYFLGFEHPNNASLFFLPIALSGCILANKKNQKLLVFIFTIVIMTPLYIATRSRTGFYLILLFLTILIATDHLKLLQYKWLFKFFDLSFFLFSLLSVFLAKTFGNDINNPINALFSNRPHIWSQVLDFPIKIIGASPGSNNFILLKHYSIDNFYIFTLVNYGIIPFLIIGYLFYKLLGNIYCSKDVQLYFTVVAFLIYGIMETNTIIPSINFSLCFLFSQYINKNYFSKTDKISFQNIVVKVKK